jgi:proteasome beta subunit
VQTVLAGFDAQGEGQIYNIDLFGSMTSEKFISTGSGSLVAYGYLEAEFKADLGVTDGYKLAIHLIEAVIRRNPGTGDGSDVVIIGKFISYLRLVILFQKISPVRHFSEQDKLKKSEAM